LGAKLVGAKNIDCMEKHSVIKTISTDGLLMVTLILYLLNLGLPFLGGGKRKSSFLKNISWLPLIGEDDLRICLLPCFKMRLYGFSFIPESILSEYGYEILDYFLKF